MAEWLQHVGAVTLTNGIFLEGLIAGNGVLSEGDMQPPHPIAPTAAERKLIVWHAHSISPPSTSQAPTIPKTHAIGFSLAVNRRG